MKRYKKKFSFIKLIFISLIVLALVAGIATLLDKFGHYQYETTISRYDLPTYDKPTKTTVTISYVNKKPRGIKMLWSTDRGEREFGGYDIEYFDDEKKIIITYDVEGNGTEYALELKPADNFMISLDIFQNVSDKYVNAVVSFDDSDPNNLKLNVYNYGITELFCNINVEKHDASYSKAFSESIEPGFNGVIELGPYIAEAREADVVKINIGDAENQDRQHIHKSYNLSNLAD